MENWQMEMEDKLDEVILSVNEMKIDFKEMKTALVGNDLNKGLAIIDRLKEIEKSVEKLKEESNKNKLIISIAMFLGTIIGFTIEMIVQWISNKK
jgi:hypothetical protein